MEPNHHPVMANEPRRFFGYRLARLSAVWRREIDADLRAFGLTDATWRPIYYLNFSKTPMRQTDLARSLFGSPFTGAASGCVGKARLRGA